MSVTPESRLKRTAKASWQEIGGETILLVLQEEKLLGLNRVAGRIWQLADGTRTAAQIADAVAGEAEVPRERILEDTLSFANLLEARGLLEAEAP